MISTLAAFALAPSALLGHAITHWRTEPETRIEDAYKWLFHATLGGEHAISDPDGPRLWMEREWSGLTSPKEHEPMTVDLTPDGKLIRVHLRPYKTSGGSKDALFEAFLSSARRFKGDKDSFHAVWQELGRTLRHRPFGKITHDEWVRLDASSSKRAYPAIHHSKAYERAYKPAYRVVLRELFDGKAARGL